ncbi:MAG: hypothetical protein F6J97_08895 [Leptolyngbya sp. SIO4C1]|nr:hypothetical protein [Leptolyngbya sp. SIO4C1]
MKSLIRAFGLLAASAVAAGCQPSQSVQCQALLQVTYAARLRPTSLADSATLLVQADRYEQAAAALQKIELSDRALLESQAALSDAYDTVAIALRRRADLVDASGTLRYTSIHPQQKAAVRSAQAAEADSYRQLRQTAAQLYRRCNQPLDEAGR